MALTFLHTYRYLLTGLLMGGRAALVGVGASGCDRLAARRLGGGHGRSACNVLFSGPRDSEVTVKESVPRAAAGGGGLSWQGRGVGERAGQLSGVGQRSQWRPESELGGGASDCCGGHGTSPVPGVRVAGALSGSRPSDAEGRGWTRMWCSALQEG